MHRYCRRGEKPNSAHDLHSWPRMAQKKARANQHGLPTMVYQRLGSGQSVDVLGEFRLFVGGVFLMNNVALGQLVEHRAHALV